MNQIKKMTMAGAALAIAAPGLAQVGIPDRPEEIHFRPLTFEPPAAEDHRRTLSNGVPVYMAPSREFPLVNITFSFKGGSYLDPEDQVGLAAMTGAMIRRGGTETVSAEDLDEEFDFLAAIASTSSGSTQSTASLNTLTSNLDESFDLFMDMLRNPGFQEDRVEVYREEALEAMKQRNDDAQDILSREWDALMYGRGHFEGRRATKAMLDSITTEDLRRFHEKVFQPGNLIIGVTGDFEPEAMLARLEQALSGWELGARMPDPPAPDHEPDPGVYYIQKDIPQGKVYIGHRGVARDHEDYFPLLVMNEILGGGGFTSRIVQRVRSDEGLAYSAGSAMRMPAYYPGEFRALFQSKSRTVALAIKIILEEIDKIRTEPVSDEELATAKNAFIETFPRRFESKQATIGTFISDEWTGRPDGYWESYRDNVRAVTAEDIRRAAARHLHPEQAAMLIVGEWSEIKPGDLEGRADMGDFFGGEATELPLRDPLTLEPIEE